MPFIMLQMASVFVGTVLFLLHSTNVKKKIDCAELEIIEMRDELTRSNNQVNRLNDEIYNLKIKLNEINMISS